MGVFLAEGLKEDYDGHRYCKPSRTNSQIVDYTAWVWSPYAHFSTTFEGRGDPNSPYVASDSLDPAQTIPDFVFGNRYTISQASGDSPPWEWDGAEKYMSVEDLMAAMQDGDGAQASAVSFNHLRSFHPGGTAYGSHAKSLFAAIADHSEGPSDDDEARSMIQVGLAVGANRKAAS